MPRDRSFHAHVYWDGPGSRETAMWLRPLLKGMDCRLGNVYDSLVGPHTLPMYQVEYGEANQQAVENFLRHNSRNLSILLHDVTGDHVADHTTGARWIGKPLDLDIEFLRLHSGE